MTYKISPKLLLGFLPLIIIACNDNNDDITNAVNKSGSVETSVRVTHLDSTRDILTTTHKIWAKNSLYKTVEYNDTLPALGIEHATGENEDGETKNVSVPKDYEIFITVK